MRRALVLAPVVAALVLSGCGTQEEKTSESASEKAAEGQGGQAADRSVCRADATGVDAAGEQFPDDWPFPPETTVYDVEERAGTGTIVTAVTSTPFRDVLAFMNGPVQQAGFAVTTGETEEHDAEANWASDDFTGRWTIRESSTCAGETTVQVLSTAS